MRTERRLAALTFCLASACVPGGPSDLPPNPGDGRPSAPDAGADDLDLPDRASDADPDSGAIDGGSLDAGDLESGDSGGSAPDSGYGGCSVSGVAGGCAHVDQCGSGFVSTPGHCPGPAAIQCCTPEGETFSCDPSDMPAPNAGLFEPPGATGCPPGMISIAGAFCIDRYEASLVEVRPDGTEQPWSPYHHPGVRRVRAVSIAGAVPQGYIDGETANAACVEAQKRLCTDTEWLRACRGPNSLVYPYGDTRMNGVCNDARSQHPAVELFPDDPNPFARIQDPCINQLPDSLDRAGANPGCITHEGAYDMMGNLHEWTADPEGTFRGGFYVDTRINGEGCLYRTTAHDTHHWDYSTGFRCCAN